jgi:hypothetical protein
LLASTLVSAIDTHRPFFSHYTRIAPSQQRSEVPGEYVAIPHTGKLLVLGLKLDHGFAEMAHAVPRL